MKALKKINNNNNNKCIKNSYLLKNNLNNLHMRPKKILSEAKI